MSRSRTVLFVSKPVEAPWNDGSKNFVRDLANHLGRYQAHVLVSRGHSASEGGAIDERVVVPEPVYPARRAGESRGFSPALLDQAHVMRRLLFGPRADVRHFVFAPNPTSSGVAHLVRRARRGPVVQSVASAPKSYANIDRLLFGDVVVTMSSATRARILEAGFRGAVVTIPPSALARARPTNDAVRAFRLQHGLGDAPIALYPGDYEVSSGADTVAAAVAGLERLGCRVVFACREKTARSRARRRELESKAPSAVHLGEVPDMGLVLGASQVVLFPVDDLYGKVDVPLVLIEALALGVPIVVADATPPAEMAIARKVPARDPEALTQAAAAALREPGADALVAAYQEHYHPAKMARAYEDLYDSL
jgi:phosphatidylinositol alpha-1,6-mannosyltransferase